MFSRKIFLIQANLQASLLKSSLSKERQDASVAQLVEQGTENPRVVGSIPTGGTINADLAHLVERRLAKAKVAGSSPVIRSRKKHLRSQVLFSTKFALAGK